MAYSGNAAQDLVSRGVNASVGPSLPPRLVRSTAPIATRIYFVVAHPDGRTAVISPALLGEYEGLGFSLGSIVKNIGNTIKKAATDTTKAVTKAVVQTGHVAGEVVTSTAGKAIIGAGLALTGVGIPAAAAFMATTQGVGTLIAPHGTIGGAAKGAAEGAVEGAVAGVAGKALTKFAPSLVTGAQNLLHINQQAPSTAQVQAANVEANAPLPSPVVTPSARTRVFPATPTPSAIAPGVPQLFPTQATQGTPSLIPSILAPATLVAGATALVKPTTKATSPTMTGKKAGATGGLSIADQIKQAIEGATSGQPSGGGGAPVVYNPGTGPLATDGGSAAPAASVAGIGGIPVPVLLGGAALLMFALAQSRR